jgi:hypothetical protein
MKLLLIGTLLVALAGVANATATFSVINMDAAGTGLNDPTPFVPVGGNNATTLGQARLNVIMEAGRVWGQRITSAQTIVIDAQFEAPTPACTPSSGVLAFAGPVTFFTQSSAPTVLLPAALADAISGVDNGNRHDIDMSISSEIGRSTCLGGRNFYLGLDHGYTPGTNFDLLNTLLHELGHGLGFISLTDQNGASPASNGALTSFDQHVYSETLIKYWPEMTPAERATASTASGTLVFNGPVLNANISAYTTATGLSNPGGHMRLYAPATWSNGSSVSHWDPVATPDLLMEPNLRPNPVGSVDLTGCVLRDIGWPTAKCPDKAPFALPKSVSGTEDLPQQITLLGSDTGGAVPLTYVILSQPTRGTLIPPPSLTSSTGVTFTYAPGANLNGVDSFTFQVSNAIESSVPATVTINVAAVNDPPVANAQTVSTTLATAVAITLSGSDVEGSALTYAVVTNPLNGSLSGIAPNLTYTPNPGFSGADSFTFRVNDGALNSTNATVSINVAGPNNPPVANAQTVSATTATSVAINLMGSDIEGSALTYFLVTNPASGALTGVLPNLTYTSNAGFVGADSFTFRVFDGALNSANATVSINVAAAATSSGAGGSSGGGGGGAFDWISLTALGVLLIQTGASRRQLRRNGSPQPKLSQT